MRNRIFTDKTEIEKIINKCEICYIGMIDTENNPYVLPFNFGYRDNFIYLHSAKSGKKIDVLKNNNKVCIAFSTDLKLGFQNENVGCSYNMKFRSVLVHGRVKFIDEYDKKMEILNVIMQKYAGRTFEYSKPSIDNVEIYSIEIESSTGKESGY